MENEGIALTRDQFLDTFGLRDDTIIAKWLGVAATPEAIQRIADAKEELYRDLVRHNGISPEPGVATWLNPASRAGVATSHRVSSAASKHRRGVGGLESRTFFPGDRLSRRCESG